MFLRYPKVFMIFKKKQVVQLLPIIFLDIFDINNVNENLQYTVRFATNMSHSLD